MTARQARGMLAAPDAACEHANLMKMNLPTLIASAARMASGMTSRARRPETYKPAG